MENQDYTTNDTFKPKKSKANKVAFSGFIMMLISPALLVIAGICQSLFGNLPEFLANVIMVVALALAVFALVMGIISLVKYKKLSPAGRALGLITVIMCNPVFLYIYLVICTITTRMVAGLSWM